MLPKFNKKIVSLVLMVVFLGFGFVVYSLYKTGDNRGYAPDQPIPYSHKLHAGVNQIPCQYCHFNVDNSNHATVPGLSTCMNCHLVVKTESPLIQKMTEMYKKGQPLEWVKVHDIPDHAYFNHKRHIAKGIDCKSCHGDVAQMDKVTQVETMNMGFCVTCHKNPRKFLPGLEGIPEKAPLECSTCHK